MVMNCSMWLQVIVHSSAVVRTGSRSSSGSEVVHTVGGTHLSLPFKKRMNQSYTLLPLSPKREKKSTEQRQIVLI